MQHSTSLWTKYISLFVMIAFTIATIITKQSTVFYILYLFWFDELIKSVFEWITYHFKKNKIENSPQFLAHFKGRFFVLGIYFVFIFVFFGLMIDWDDSDLIMNNLLVLFFKNPYFNLSLVTFIVREILLFRQENLVNEPKILFSSSVLILHISILMGMLFWFLSTQKIEVLKEYATVISIVPFLILKVLFEVKSEN